MFAYGGGAVGQVRTQRGREKVREHTVGVGQNRLFSSVRTLWMSPIINNLCLFNTLSSRLYQVP